MTRKKSSGLFRKGTFQRRSHHQARRLRLESLERRELLSINLSGNVLNIDGYSGADDADVWFVGSVLKATLNSEPEFSVPTANVGKIVFRGYDGSDSFLNLTNVASEADGGRGNDTLWSGGSVDVLRGGSGNDTLAGGGGNDFLYGNSGNDTLYGFDGDDILYGLEDSDTLYGGNGRDTLYGDSDTEGSTDPSDDTIVYAGNDTLYGGSGNDTLRGGAGSDRLAGEADDDVLRGGLGNDVYLFDADNSLGSDTLEEIGGQDALDFSATTGRSLAVDLGSSAQQVVNGRLTLTLGAATTFEDVIGGEKDDVLRGNTLANRLEGRGGNDTLSGLAGNDTYVFDADFSLGSDNLQETSGQDTLDFSPTTGQSVTVDLAVATPQTVNGRLTLTLASATAFENVIGGEKDDTLRGNALANRLEGRGGNDTLHGLAGNDIYVFDADVSLGSDTLRDTSGHDTLDFSPTTEKSLVVDLGISGRQTVNANLAVILVSPLAWENVLGGTRNDTLVGNAAGNTLSGGEGDDTLCGLGNNDTLLGGGGNDTLVGHSGNDAFNGGAGNDNYMFDCDTSLGNDVLSDASGDDTLDFSPTTSQSVTICLGVITQQIVNANLRVTLTSASAFENVTGGDLRDILMGSEIGNRMEGGGGDDDVFGREGNDTLYGDGGNDTLYGGSGDDFLCGGSGTDTLYGGSGNDGLFGGADYVVDYLSGLEGDDRFLVRSDADDERDRSDNDVKIRFSSGSSTWTEREVRNVDQAFYELQERTGSTRILKDTMCGDSLNLVKEDSTVGYAGLNEWWEEWDWSELGMVRHRKIHIADWNEFSESANQSRRATTIHEIAHNWDSHVEADHHPSGDDYWDDFEEAHAVSDSPDDYAEAYGMTDIMEDWATCVEAAMGYTTRPNPSPVLLNKLAAVDRFFADMVEQPDDEDPLQENRARDNLYPCEVKTCPPRGAGDLFDDGRGLSE